MDYIELCEVYHALESTSKGLEKIKILSEFLEKIVEEPNLIYLLQGKVFADWDSQELGISHQLAIRAIGRASGQRDAEVLDKFRELGELGSVAEFMVREKKQQKALFNSKLSVEKVMANLKKIPLKEGKGTVDLMF